MSGIELNISHMSSDEKKALGKIGRNYFIGGLAAGAGIAIIASGNSLVLGLAVVALSVFEIAMAERIKRY